MSKVLIGSTNSSNSNRLRDLGEEMGITSYLIDDARSLQPEWLDHAHNIGITAGASAPEWLVQDVVRAIQIIKPATVQPLIYKQESTIFKLPKELTEQV